VRDFLTYARKSGFLSENLAVHVKMPKAARKSASRVAAPTDPTSVWLTQQGYDQLQERLVWLQEEMVSAAAEIKKAAADKDVRENAPLEAAREHLGQLDGRRRETEEALKLAQVIGEDGAGAGVVRQGGAITLLDVSTGQSQEWLLVDPREAAPLDGRLSTTSPVGHAVLGRREGDEVDVSAPRGMVRYRIVHAQ
jgi:transcription elongation factor GreA